MVLPYRKYMSRYINVSLKIVFLIGDGDSELTVFKHLFILRKVLTFFCFFFFNATG